jgi:hypothetical protein
MTVLPRSMAENVTSRAFSLFAAKPSFTIQGEPVRDRERLIWSLDLRPT